MAFFVFFFVGPHVIQIYKATNQQYQPCVIILDFHFFTQDSRKVDFHRKLKHKCQPRVCLLHQLCPAKDKRTNNPTRIFFDGGRPFILLPGRNRVAGTICGGLPSVFELTLHRDMLEVNSYQDINPPGYSTRPTTNPCTIRPLQPTNCYHQQYYTCILDPALEFPVKINRSFLNNTQH